jgi:hypothetical protein
MTKMLFLPAPGRVPPSGEASLIGSSLLDRGTSSHGLGSEMSRTTRMCREWTISSAWFWRSWMNRSI